MTDWPSLLAKAQAALAAGRADLAMATLAPAGADPGAPVEVLRALSSACRSEGRNREAVQLLQRLVDLQPASPVAEHNLAAACGDRGDAPNAHAAAQRALAKGGDAPETWLVFARALAALSRLDEAESALREALVRRTDYGDALRDLAQLIWMRDGDAGAALAVIDDRLAVAARPEALAVLRASIARDILGDTAGWETLKPWLSRAHGPALDLAASAAASGLDPLLALRLAEAAVGAAPGDLRAETARLAALIACGRAVEALPGLDSLIGVRPVDQYALALRYTAWRLVGDPRALTAADYRRLVTPFDLQAPADVEPSAWLERVAAGLRRLHPFRAEPLGQSIRSGAQAALDPRFAGDPAIDAVFAALESPIDAYVSAMAGRQDPMSLRARPAHEIVGAWSVRLTAGGRHSDHIHPAGWVSSALYVVTPEASADAPRAGWLRFGAARLGVGLDLPAEYWVEPQPGRVVLFPSWMWHGTEPFSGAGERLTIAFDVQPR